MDRNKITVKIEPLIKGAAIKSDAGIEIFLQRQGASENFLFCDRREDGATIFIDVGKTRGGNLAEIRIRNGENKKVVCFYETGISSKWVRQSGIAVASTIAAVEMVAIEFYGKPVSVRKENMAYMFNDANDDTILSPFVYEPETDTIRAARENYCLVAFEEFFVTRKTNIDAMAAPYLLYFEKALQKGFHACDAERGDDYCKRRFAWLAGAYFMEAAADAKESVFVGLLTKKMEWPALWAADRV